MLSISNDKTLKNVKCQFCYSSTMEELMSFHVMAEPELHPACGDFAMHIHDMLPKDLQKEIDYIGRNFGHWYYILDLVGTLIDESANYQCDFNAMAEKIMLVPMVEFIYYVLGLSVHELDITLDTFAGWSLDEERCREELSARGYELMDMDIAAYVLANSGELKNRLIEVLKDYWDFAFSKEWESISSYVKDIIVYEEISLSHTTLLEYLKQFHSQLKIDGGMLIFDKKPMLAARISQIESLTITPTIFGDNHLHGSVYGNRVNMNLNLNYRALQVSKPIPDSYFQLMRVLSDESRFKILKVLWNGEATTKEISDILRLSPSTISLHLKMLREADLVTSSKIKKFVYYRLKKDKLLTLQDQMLNYLKY
ncbi:MAG: metalloregulator ArsR/SmtB family transcription factor [Clostridium sp.]|nr:metalloregulator ArsR/SmtB family transcription factor [Clostridium sp.]